MNKVNAFFSSFQHLGKTFFPLICVVTFYAVIGMSLFQGHVESRCRLTEHPEKGSDVWEVDETNHLTCGYLSCPTGTYCGNPADYDLPFDKHEAKVEPLLFGYNLFNSIEWALFSVYNFLMVVGWIQTTYMYWRAQDKAIAAIYFVTLVLFLSQVISNIILATLYEGFIDETSIKNEKDKKKHDTNSNNNNNINGSEKGSQYINQNDLHQNGKSIQRKNVLLNIGKEDDNNEQQNYNEQNNTSQNKVKENTNNNIQMIDINDKQDKKNNSVAAPQSVQRMQHNNVSHDGKILNRGFTSSSANSKQQQNQHQHQHQQQDQQQLKRQLTDHTFLQQMSNNPIMKGIFLANLFLQIIILCLDNHSINQNDYMVLNEIDFGTMIMLLLETIYMLSKFGIKNYLSDNINFIDIFVIITHIISYVFELSKGQDIFNPIQQIYILVRCTKVLRFFKIFYHYEFFLNMTVILKTYYQTLKSIPEYILVFGILVILFAQIGRELFAYTQPEDDHHVLRVNFDSLSDSLIAVVLIFYNEEWHISMYNYMRFVGYKSIIYYLICTLIGWVLFVRLFIAIFISQFMKWLRLNEQEYKMKADKFNSIDMIIKRFTNTITNLINRKSNNKMIKVVHAAILQNKFSHDQQLQIQNLDQLEKESNNHHNNNCLEKAIFQNNHNINNNQYITVVTPSINNHENIRQQQQKQGRTSLEYDDQDDQQQQQDDEQDNEQEEEEQNFRTFGNRGGKKPTIIGIRKNRQEHVKSIDHSNIFNHNNPSDILINNNRYQDKYLSINYSSRPMNQSNYNDIQPTIPTDRNISIIQNNNNRLIESNQKSNNHMLNDIVSIKSNSQINVNNADEDYLEPKNNINPFVKDNKNGYHQRSSNLLDNNNINNNNNNNNINTPYQNDQQLIKLNNESDDEDDYNNNQYKSAINQLSQLNKQKQNNHHINGNGYNNNAKSYNTNGKGIHYDSPIQQMNNNQTNNNNNIFQSNNQNYLQNGFYLNNPSQLQSQTAIGLQSHLASGQLHSNEFILNKQQNQSYPKNKVITVTEIDNSSNNYYHQNSNQQQLLQQKKQQQMQQENIQKQSSNGSKFNNIYKNNNNNNQNQQLNIINEYSDEDQDISLFIFSRNNKFRIFCKSISDSIIFDISMVISIIIFGGVLVWDSPFLNPKSKEKQIIKIFYYILAGLFSLELFVHLVQYGMIFNGPNSYLRKNVAYLIDFLTTIATIIYVCDISPKTNFVFKCFAIFRIIFLLSFLSKYNKDIAFAGRLMAYCSSRMIKLIIFAIIYLFMNGIVLTKLLKNSNWKCQQYYHPSSHDVFSKQDCFDLGGDWIQNQYSFNTIVDSLSVLFVVQASEGWLQIMLDAFDSNTSNYQLYFRQQSLWSVFFIQYFFIANICILNMFVGLIVESLLELLEHEHGTHALTKQQKEWYFIKKSINKLVPIKKDKEPLNNIGKFLFQHMITGNSLKIIFYTFSAINGISFLFFKNRQTDYQHDILCKIIYFILFYSILFFDINIIIYLINKQKGIINLVCLTVLGIEIICRMISLNLKQYFLQGWNIFDIVILIVGLINYNYQMNETITIFSSNYRILDGISKGMQLLRLIRVFNHFLIFRKLFNSLNYALSSILGIALILIVFLYTSVLLSLNLFPYLKFQSTINDYDINFQDFFTALFSFIRIVTLEMWYLIPFEASQQMQPNFVCRDDMYQYEDFAKYGYQSCGSFISYVFFYGFFLIFTLIILNLFIATIIESYKEAFSADESAINHYQLDDILKLWTKYDPEGKGYISYKEFWQFSSQIAIVYGVSSSELLDIENKNKFLKTLNIPIYEDPIDKIFCYKFHDVVVNLSKMSVQIKYGVTNLEPKNKKLREELETFIKARSLKFEKNIKSTEFSSGDMILMIVLSRKAKVWKKRYVEKVKGDEANMFNIQSLFKRVQSTKQTFLQQIKDQIKKEEEEELKLQQQQQN